MTTNPQIERMAEALSNLNLPSMIDGNVIRVNRMYWQLIAQALYDVSDARLVPMLADALKSVYECGFNEDGLCEPCNAMIKQALAQLPEEYR